ncbi:protein of unknown function [Azospirillum baldaniorum]|uniref:Uncharacterized protein n=1 Tax=Azospirillum baldaniorum TaxID=1064539 RepID=A0A9P1JR00_9PROT|nr:protein of unknown function [Azospirillum baldaniorum]
MGRGSCAFHAMPPVYTQHDSAATQLGRCLFRVMHALVFIASEFYGQYGTGTRCQNHR